MKLVRVELEWEDGSIKCLSGDAAEEWHQQQSGAATMAWVHGARYTDGLRWETVRAKTHDVPDDMDPVLRKVRENGKAFYAMLPELRKTLAGRCVVMQDCQVAKDFVDEGEAYKYALERWGPDGGFALCPVEGEPEPYAPPRPLSSAEIEEITLGAAGITDETLRALREQHELAVQCRTTYATTSAGEVHQLRDEKALEVCDLLARDLEWAPKGK